MDVRAHSDAVRSIKGKANNWKRNLQPAMERGGVADKNLGFLIQVDEKGHLSSICFQLTSA